jgi:hypothetical protein
MLIVREYWIDLVTTFLAARNSVVGIATRYKVDGLRIKSRWGRDFPQIFGPALGPTQPLVQRVSGPFPGVKRPGRGVDHPSQSSAEVKERVELYFPSGSSWPFLGWPLPIFLDSDIA